MFPCRSSLVHHHKMKRILRNTNYTINTMTWYMRYIVLSFKPLVPSTLISFKESLLCHRSNFFHQHSKCNIITFCFENSSLFHKLINREKNVIHIIHNATSINCAFKKGCDCAFNCSQNLNVTEKMSE